MIIHRLTMLTENDSSEHLLAKIKSNLLFLIYYHVVINQFQLTRVRYKPKDI